MTIWTPGDIGRLSMESSAKPRFMFLGFKADKAVVWYGGSPKPQAIEKGSFNNLGVQDWNMSVVRDLPAWIVKDAKFNFGPDVKVAQAHVRHSIFVERDWGDLQLKHHTQEETSAQIVNLSARELVIVSIRYDYAACWTDEKKDLVLVPLKVLKESGSSVVSSLDRLLNQSDLFEDY